MSKGAQPDAAGSACVPAPLIKELYAAAHAGAYGLRLEEWAEILDEAACRAGFETSPAAVESNKDRASKGLADFLRQLRIGELALARACARGHETAWEIFLTRYRVKLYDTARQITREDASARELADSIHAELYGTVEREGQRISKLDSYGGRGSLEGWLRTVMAQEWVNRYRKKKRSVSLEEMMEEGAQFAAAEAPPAPAQTESQVAAATGAALADVSSEDRYILASYFLDRRTLAEVARTLGVHESTISRKVERLAKTLRKRIMDHLIRGGMDRRQAEEAMEVDVRDLHVDVRGKLAAAPAGANPANLLGAAAQDPPVKPFHALDKGQS